jgi:ribosomal protein S17
MGILIVKEGVKVVCIVVLEKDTKSIVVRHAYKKRASEYAKISV